MSPAVKEGEKRQFHITKHARLDWWYIWVDDGSALGKYLHSDKELYPEVDPQRGRYRSELEARTVIARMAFLEHDLIPLEGRLP